MVAQSVRRQFAFQFFVAVLTFTTFAVLVVNAVRQRASSGAIGHHSSAVRSLGVRFALDDDPPRLLPGSSLIVKAGEEPLRLTSFSAFFHCILQ